MLDTELLPCPHCGGPANCLPQYVDTRAQQWRVFCDALDCTLGMRHIDRAEAIKHWNRRA